MVALEFDASFLGRATASELRLERLGKVLDAYLFFIEAFDNGHPFPELSLDYGHNYPLLLAGYFLANTEFLW